MFELEAQVNAEDWHEIEALLETAGALAITQSDGDRKIFDEPGISSGASAEWQAFRVTALFESEAQAEGAAVALKARDASQAVAIKALAARDWSQAWKDEWQAETFAGGLCVCPSWLSPPENARHVIAIDPGQAFGTGSHASTAMCLDWLGQRDTLSGQTVIDYGCRSAILAIAAARLGATQVSAIDIDQQALTVARDNILRNELSGRIEVADGQSWSPHTCDVLIANILFEPLLELEALFATLLAPGGELVLAGILETQAEALIETYAADFELDIAARTGEWVLLHGKRRSAAA